jgi:hypothetical protein
MTLLLWTVNLGFFRSEQCSFRIMWTRGDIFLVVTIILLSTSFLSSSAAVINSVYFVKKFIGLICCTLKLVHFSLQNEISGHQQRLLSTSASSSEGTPRTMMGT